MKKEDITGLIVYLFILVFAIVFGFTVLNQHAGTSYVSIQGGMFAYMGFMFGAIVLGVILNSILFEVAHILGAKVGGYDIESVNILGFCFYKEDKKIKFKFSSFDGLSGETKIYPKDNLVDKKGNPKQASPYGYLWFGSLFVIIEVIIAMILFSLLNVEAYKNTIEGDFAYFILTVGMIGFMILIYNILPFKLDSTTDGYRLTLVSNPKNKEAFNELLKVNRAMSLGLDVEIKTFTEITNFTAELNLNKVYKLLEERNYNEAEPLIDMIIAAKEQISYKVYIAARAQKIYIHLMNNSVEEAQKYYDEQVDTNERREIADDVSMPSIRAYLLMSGILDKSRSECLIALNNVMKAYKHTNKNRREVEVSLFNETLKKVIEAHPKWELDGYLLTSKESKEKK